MAQSEESLIALGQSAALYNEGRYQDAIPYAEFALKHGGREFGLDHIKTTAIMEILAELYMFDGQLTEAESLYRRIVPIRVEILGLTDIKTIASLIALAFALDAQGRYADSEQIYKQV